ncbi:MAG: aminotransferase class IV [Eubacteriales bacterium]
MKNLGYYNGSIDLIENITVPMNDRASCFGDGCYDAMYCRNYIIYCLNEHLDRLYNSAALLDIHPSCTKAELADLLQSLIRRVDDHEQFIYVQFSRGTAPRGHAYGTDMPSNLWITLTPEHVHDTYAPTTCITVPDTRFYHCNIKTLNLLPNVLAAEKARRAGCHEAIFYRPAYEGAENGMVTECAHSNVHAIIDGVFRTHATDHLILPGIGRMNLLKMCRKLGIPYAEIPFTKADLFTADEVILSSSGQFCIPIASIDGRKVGGRGGEILKSLQDALVRDWLDVTNG